MRKLKIPLLLVASLLVTGCATTNGGWYSSARNCAISGGVPGAIAGILLDGGIVGGVVGAGAGAVLAQVFCGSGEAPKAMAKPTGDSDADKDGVPDSRDRCPKSPKGQVVDEYGCPFDSDGDGVPDTRDSCPNTPIGVEVDVRGCPTDSDNDGVADYKDRCPSTPFGQAVDQWGCSKVGEQLAVLENVNFDFDKATLRSNAQSTLQQVAATLRNNPAIGVNIVGHTDATGPESYNMGLSMRRARAVRDFLTRAGVGGHRMGVEGKGESQPAASNGSSAGRAKNRRVEFIVSSK